MNPEQLAEQTIEAINDRNRGKLDELTTEDVQLFLPPAQVFRGRPGLSAFFDELERRVPDLTLTAREFLTGEDFCVVQWETAGHSPASQPVEALGCLVLRSRDGTVSRAHLYLDTATWQRLGREVDGGA